MITLFTTAVSTPSPTSLPTPSTAASSGASGVPTASVAHAAVPTNAPWTSASAAATAPASTASASTSTGTQTGKGSGTSLDTAVVGFLGLLVAALIVAGWNIVLARRKGREDERAHQRAAFADALRAAVSYKEMPYAVRRRDKNNLSLERVRLSEIVRGIQAELSYHQTWIRSESQAVATAYDALVMETRKVAGTAMRDAWNAAPITHDNQMNISPELVDVRGLATFEEDYTKAVTAHMAGLTPWWCR